MNRPEIRRAEKIYEKVKQYSKSGFTPQDTDGILDTIFVNPEVDKMLSEEFGWYNRPVIYAFKTSLVPDAIKIGFTFRYHERIEEWKEKYPDLEIVGGPWDAFFLMRDTLYFFRDEPVHQNAEGENHLFIRLTEKDFAETVYPSKEFFAIISKKDENLTKEAIANLVREVRESILNGERIYHYFRHDEVKKKTFVGMPEKDDCFEANERQNIARSEAKAAMESGVKKWLLAAVMRFGKTFTSLMISKDMGAKLTVVLTGKADVRGEWRRAIFHANLFTKRLFVEFVKGKGANFKVLVSGNYNGKRVWMQEMPLTDNFFKNLIDEGYSVVVFGTLQDFAGSKVVSGREIKRKHKELFNMEIDLLIVDETHYGARGSVYGKTISKNAEEIEGNEDGLKKEEKEMLEEHALVDALQAKYQLHLSGTPYRIMTSGEFEADGCRVISTVSYQDQLKDKNDWLKRNPDKEDSECPLFGLPTMRMYGIKLTKECREILKRSLESGNSLSDSISALFKCDKNGNLIYERQIKELLEAFFNGLLKKIHDTNPFVANHIACLLPSVAACHAVADLFNEIVAENEFNCFVAVQGKVGNIIKRWSEECKDVTSLNAALTESEKNGKRTIVFTVNRLTTGTTIPFWDTMLYLRGGENPETYDQARFRLASRNIEEYEEEGRSLKLCKKNEILFFDFQPDRMLAVRADAVRSEKKEEAAIKEELDTEVKQIAYKNLDSFNGSFREYESIDFMKALYEFDRHSFADSMYKYDALLENQSIQELAKRFSGAGFGSNVRKLSPFDGDGNSDTDDKESPEIKENDSNKKSKCGGAKQNKTNFVEFKKWLKNVMLRVHFFVACLRDVFIDNGIDGLYEHLIHNEADRMLLEKEFLLTVDDIAIIRDNMTGEMKDFFCGECFRITHYLNGGEHSPEEKVKFISERCGKVSESGVAVPENIAKKMLEGVLCLLNNGNKTGKILEIGSIYGEYLIEVWKFNDPTLIERFRVLPLNGITGEIIKRVCNLLGISENIVLSDLIRDEESEMADIKLFIDENKNEKIKKTLLDMKIDAIVGNPPYQGVGKSQIYPKFYLIAKEISSDVVSLIFPRNWQKPVGGNGLKCLNNREIKEDKQIVLIDNRDKVFDNVGGAKETNIVLWKKGFDNGLNGAQNIYDNGVFSGVERLQCEKEEKTKDKTICQLGDVVIESEGFKSLQDITLEYNPYGFRTDVGKLDNETLKKKYGHGPLSSEKVKESDIKLFTDYTTTKYIPETYNLKKNKDTLYKYKVAYCKTWGNGEIDSSYSKILILRPGEICTEKFMISGVFDTKEEAKRHAKFLITPFSLSLLYLGKEGISTNKVWGNVPLQTYSEPWWNTDNVDLSEYEDNEIMYLSHQLFKKYGAEDFEDYVNKSVKHKRIKDSILYYD